MAKDGDGGDKVVAWSVAMRGAAVLVAVVFLAGTALHAQVSVRGLSDGNALKISDTTLLKVSAHGITWWR